jgi:hypothetical protein
MFFLGRNHDAVVDCVPTCVGLDNPPLTLNFAHRRSAGSGEYA